jgi:hypothetical protein
MRRVALIVAVVPLLVSVAERKSRADQSEIHKVVLGPVTQDEMPEDEPLNFREVLRLLDIREESINRARVEKVSEYTDPPRVYPLVGPARLCHVRYRCTIESEAGVSHAVLDLNHLHLLGQ